MKSKVKMIIVFGIIVVLLAAAIVVLKLTDKTDEEIDDTNKASSSTASASQLLYDKNPSDISMITITNDAGTYQIERFGEGDISVWTVVELIQVPTSYTVINTILEKSASMTMQQLVMENAEDISIYGLTNPRATVKVEFTDTNNTVKEILIGNETPSYGKTYFCFKGETTVYTVNTSDISCFLEDKYAIVNKTLYTAFVSSDENDTNDYTRINKMVIARKDIDYEIVIEYDKRLDNPEIVTGNSSSYVMTSPVSLDLSPDKSSDVTSAVFGLTATSVEVITPSEIQKAQYGFASPYADISMDIAGGDFHMVVGNETPDKTGRYCMAQDIDIIYILSNDLLPWVKVMPLDLTTTLITSNYVLSLTSLDITGSDVDAHFTMTGSTNDDFVVNLSGKSIDLQAFKSFYQFILKAPAEELYLDNSNNEPYLTVTIKSAANTDVLSFINTQNRRTIIKLNGRNSFSCKTAYVERLIENLHHLENGEDLINTW